MDFFHLLFHQGAHRLDFILRNFKDQFVMDLHDEAAFQPFPADPVEHVYHRLLDDVRR